MKMDLVGLKMNEMLDYVKCTADVVLENRGYQKLYNTTNPLTWMALIALPNKTNFFESKVTEYRKPTLGNIDWDNIRNVRI
jgi:ribonucleotide reductase beta subunit family protein with ferritin-like domain